jgi:AraC family transcriptional regulator of adaptative response / DNA-3-methyladenine glycosylase II
MIHFLAGRATTSTELIDGDRYVRTVRIGNHLGWIAAEPMRHNLLRVEVAPTLMSVLPELLIRLRRLFDLDANPAVIDDYLVAHKKLAAHVTRTVGLRVPGTLSGFELALRAVLGQQITVKAATTVFGRFVDVFGAQVETPFNGISKVAPTAADIANATLEQLIARGLTSKRAATISTLARAVADKQIILDPPVDFSAAREALQSLPGIGPWTAEYIAMRSFGDPDAFPHSDLGLLHALKIDKPAKLLLLSEKWRPWRSYAALHLWHSLGQGG